MVCNDRRNQDMQIINKRKKMRESRNNSTEKINRIVIYVSEEDNVFGEYNEPNIMDLTYGICKDDMRPLVNIDDQLYFLTYIREEKEIYISAKYEIGKILTRPEAWKIYPDSNNAVGYWRTINGYPQFPNSIFELDYLENNTWKYKSKKKKEMIVTPRNMTDDNFLVAKKGWLSPIMFDKIQDQSYFSNGILNNPLISMKQEVFKLNKPLLITKEIYYDTLGLDCKADWDKYRSRFLPRFRSWMGVEINDNTSRKLDKLMGI